MLALVDFIGLFWNFLIYKYLPLINVGLDLVSSFTCFPFKWIARVFQQYPLYTQAFINLVNLLKVKYPRRFNFLNKNINIIYMMILILLFVMVINTANMFQYITYKNGTATSCAQSNTNNAIANFINALIRSVIPFIIMATLDYITIQTLFISKKKISNDLSKQKSFAILLLILDLLFFIFNFPLSVTNTLNSTYKDVLSYPSNGNTMALLGLLHDFANTFAFIYLLAPFFINLIFNTIFRQEIVLMLFGNKLAVFRAPINPSINPTTVPD
jgi:hypothetical protein